MKPFRYSLAILIMRGAGIVAELIAPEVKDAIPARPPLRPVEQMLLASIVGMSICALWIWIVGKVGGAI